MPAASVPWKIFALFVIDMKVLLVIGVLLIVLQDSFPLWLPQRNVLYGPI